MTLTERQELGRTTFWDLVHRDSGEEWMWKGRNSLCE